MFVGWGHGVWMGVACHCPPVRNNSVTPRHLFKHFRHNIVAYRWTGASNTPSPHKHTASKTLVVPLFYSCLRKGQQTYGPTDWETDWLKDGRTGGHMDRQSLLKSFMSTTKNPSKASFPASIEQWNPGLEWFIHEHHLKSSVLVGMAKSFTMLLSTDKHLLLTWKGMSYCSNDIHHRLEEYSLTQGLASWKNI